MKFEHVPEDEQSRLRVAFSQSETPVIKAMYREKMVNLALGEQSKDITDFDIFMSRYGENGKRPCVLIQPVRLLGVISKFVRDTDGELTELANSGTPAYLNDDLAVRKELSKKASTMAAQVLEFIAPRSEDIEVPDCLPDPGCWPKRS